MSKEQQVTQLTDNMAKFIAHIAKKLPDDVIEKLTELREKEDSQLSKVIYDTMFKNQELAVKLNRPSCQDTGVLQFWVKCGTKFPLIDELEGLLKDAVVKATFEAPLRHNSVETFDEYNTGKNVGKGTPTVFWDIVPNSDKCEIYTYMAGGGCTLPGKAMVLMPGEGYEGVTKFVMDVMTTYGLNACPPLLVGVGVATSVETAALLSKKALMLFLTSTGSSLPSSTRRRCATSRHVVMLPFRYTMSPILISFKSSAETGVVKIFLPFFTSTIIILPPYVL